ncbi:hypothetical protein [Streptomyces sp. NPDC088794]|uniref:hypothetical protein n=1 Tax=Streptomyces sp. NPDC088794 TaxID=3365902 RepID=UPI00380D98A1
MLLHDVRRVADDLRVCVGAGLGGKLTAAGVTHNYVSRSAQAARRRPPGGTPFVPAREPMT